MKTINARRINSNSLFKYTFIGYATLIIFLFVLFALGSLISDDIVVNVGGDPLSLSTWLSLSVSIIIGAFAVAFGSWLSLIIGFWAWSKFKPIRIEYEEFNETDKDL